MKCRPTTFRLFSLSVERWTLSVSAVIDRRYNCPPSRSLAAALRAALVQTFDQQPVAANRALIPLRARLENLVRLFRRRDASFLFPSFAWICALRVYMK